MPTSYRPPPPALFDAFAGFPQPTFDYPVETFKDYVAPILRVRDGARTTDPATFGFVPRRRIPPEVKVFETMNAPVETISEDRCYRTAWELRQFCLIPCEAFYEPNYETGGPVRWAIGLLTGQPFAITGLWRKWTDLDGDSLAFTILTVDATEHALMKQFGIPGVEKHSAALLRPENYEDWLRSRGADGGAFVVGSDSRRSNSSNRRRMPFTPLVQYAPGL